MKYISERENRTQFEGFHSLVYDLVDKNLQGTQIVIIDKELCAPPDELEPRTLIRHMTLTEEENSPLDIAAFGPDAWEVCVIGRQDVSNSFRQ